MSEDSNPNGLTGKRSQASAVRRYLEMLERAHVLDPERAEMAHRMARLRRQIAASTDEQERGRLEQTRLEVEQAMWAARDAVEARHQRIEEGFVAAVLPYSQRKGISTEAWRIVGVPDEILQRAGLSD